MEPILPRRDPSDAAGVWSLPPGQKARPSVHHLVITLMLLVPMTLTATLGSITFSSPDGTAIVSFWPAAAFQVVFSIWFGVYGALAGIIGPMLGNSLVGASAFQYIPANAIQSCLAGLWFRYRILDPRLRSRRDWIALLLVGCILSNALGAITGVAESILRGMGSGGAVNELAFWANKTLTWFLGNAIPCILLAPALLKTISPMIVRDPIFCPSFWGGVLGKRRRSRIRFIDLPMSGKLTVLVLVTGILPLVVVASWFVWSTVNAADHLAVAMNRRAVYETRNEIERHELLLRTWAAELDRPDGKEEDRAKLIAEWRSIADGFTQLEVADRAQIESEMAPNVQSVFEKHGIVFYRLGGAEAGALQLRGVVRLRSTAGEVLTGVVAWRQDIFAPNQRESAEGILVLDEQGNVIDRNVPPELANWLPERQAGDSEAYTIAYGGRMWHVAEALTRSGVRFIAITSLRSGLMTGLAAIPSPVAVLINLAIFGSLIAGGAVAARISRRVLAIAEGVHETGGEPGKLHLPVHGRDELGYLAQTLNDMSDSLAVSVKQLQEATAEKERLAAEMDLARQVQQKILPSEPLQVTGYELAAASYPAREVGGDFFDWFLREDGKVITMVGDAAGKGLKAAMFITEAHALAHAAAQWLPQPHRILTAINSAMMSERREAENFVTMLCTTLEAKSHSLLYANAGHNPPILVHEGCAQPIEIGELPLAVLSEVDYPLGRIRLAPGDTLLLYTDGITDAANLDGDFFGLKRLEALAAQHAALPANELLKIILGEVNAFADNAPQTDDMTLVILRRTP